MTSETINLFSQLISSVGFPIVIAGYMVVKMNKTIEDNNLLLTQLKSVIETLVNERNDKE